MSNNVITTLNHKIQKLDNEKLERDLMVRKEDFSRRPKKISFIDDIKLILAMGAQSIRKELYKYFNYDLNTITSSGFVQSRAKIKDKTFKELLDLINKAYPCKKTYKGYRLIACDGSDISIFPNPNDTDTFIKSGHKTYKGHNRMHVNALYDVLNNRYLDAVIQTNIEYDEHLALITMIERLKQNKAIIIADRGYEGYNTFEHIRHTGNYFLIRIKDVASSRNNLKRFSFPTNKEFDKTIKLTSTNKQTYKTKSHPEKYRLVMSNQKFDYVDKNHPYYTNKYRFVRIKIEGKKETYETIITNLPNSFKLNDIKELYKLRWNIEVSFKHLKYSIGLSALHSKRKDFIRQEILARLVMYNVVSIIIENIKVKKFNKKYDYKVNITLAIFLIKEQYIKTKGLSPPNLNELIANNILPIRKGRNYKRNIRAQGFVPFGYRF